MYNANSDIRFKTTILKCLVYVIIVMHTYLLTRITITGAGDDAAARQELNGIKE